MLPDLHYASNSTYLRHIPLTSCFTPITFHSYHVSLLSRFTLILYLDLLHVLLLELRLSRST
jgi:hypothetical protein